jgi:hypothetical protein
MSCDGRNQMMVAKIRTERTEVAKARCSFVVAGDSGAWADPTADAIFSSLIERISRLEPPPLFFANLGDFAGPGTRDRHEHYLRLVEPLPIPNICIIGNHDLDDPSGWDAWHDVHGPMNFDFACGNTRFIAIHAAPGTPGQVDIAPGDARGPRDEDLEFLAQRLGASNEPTRVVLMHMPPHMNGHYEPHPEWGFRDREAEFFALLREHAVRLVCCAHGLALDMHVQAGVQVVMSGGGGSGLCSHLRGVCTAGPGYPEDRGALFHAVELTIESSGEISARVLQAFDSDGEKDRTFTLGGNPGVADHSSRA